MDFIWIAQHAKYSKIENESRKSIVFPAIKDLIGNSTKIKILDYGCGDGSFLEVLSNQIEIGLYDISSKALKLAEKRFSDRKLTIYQNADDIPVKHYDFIVCSLVLMTIETEEGLIEVFEDLKRCKSENGKVIIAITHPCFRQFHFSSFHAEYAKGKRFNYFNNGEKFLVQIKDLNNNKYISFYDYHWSLSKMLSLLFNAGLKMTKFIELSDTINTEITQNNLVPPYIVIECE